MAVEDPDAGEVGAVPHLDGVVAEPAHDLGVVVLQAVHAFAVLRPGKDLDIMI